VKLEEPVQVPLVADNTCPSVVAPEIVGVAVLVGVKLEIADEAADIAEVAP